jgi:hypothetical protein
MKKYPLTKFRLLFTFVLATLLVSGIVVHILRTQKFPALSPYPDGKNFAFTITADPDYNDLEKDKLIYDFFTEVGLRTTIAVWVKESTRSNGIPDISTHLQYGSSCENDDYLRYMQELQKRGFEIALHTVTSGNDYREETIEGYERFREFFGAYPNINIMHSTNLENVYWGKKVVENGLLKRFIGILADGSNFPYGGDDPKSKYFWGDILRQKTKYVRLWGTPDINTLKLNPSMPYHNPKKPFVNYWFSFSDGRDVDIFNQLLSEKNIKRLTNERGASIVYVHFAGFISKGKLNEAFKSRIEIMARQKDGWFVPATTLLDRLLLMKKVRLTVLENALFVANLNSCSVDAITVLVHPKEIVYNSMGIPMEANEEGEIVLENFKPGESKILLRDLRFIDPKNEHPTYLEKFNMFLQRSLVYFSHNW